MGRLPATPKPTQHIAERMGLWLKLILLGVVPLYLVVDFLIGFAYFEDRQREHATLCTPNLAAPPVTILGKLHLFARCADFTEFSFLGAKAKILDQLIVAKDKTEEDVVTLSVIAEAKKQIILLADQLNLPMDNEVKALVENLQLSSVKLKETVGSREQVIDQLEASIVVPVGDPAVQDAVFLLIVGADQGNKAAIDQVEITRKILEASQLGIDPNRVQLRLIRSWRRTVIVFRSRDSAKAAFKGLKDDLPFGGYVRAQRDWCSDLKQVAGIASIETWRCKI